jgi:hypothetical protein
MARESVTHWLSFAVRFVDHFSGEPVADELPVRLAGSLMRPALRPGGGGYRQSDGAYRFVGAPGGPAKVLWRTPLARTEAGWTRWTDDPQIGLPLADPGQLVLVDLWPTAAADPPAGATGVRGKLVGPNPEGLTVRIAVQGQAFDRFTLSDAAGDFLFLPPGRLAPTPAGRVPLTIEVRDAAGVARAVTGGTFAPSAAGPDFVGANFTIAPRTAPRIRFRLA